MRRRGRQRELESENPAKNEPAGCYVVGNKRGRSGIDSVADFRVAKTIERREVAGVFQERINALEVGMIEDIGAGRPELERCTLSNLEELRDRQVGDVGAGILHKVPG